MSDTSWNNGTDEHPAGKIMIRISAITAASRPWILAGLVAGATVVATAAPAAAAPPVAVDAQSALVGVLGEDDPCGGGITTCTWTE